MSNATQLVFPVEYEEPYSYLDPSRPGFFSLLTKAPGKRPQQQSHRLEYLSSALGGVDPTMDTWITQNEFFKPNRRMVNVWRLLMAFVDLDTYKVPSLANLSPMALVDGLLRHCENIRLPEPSIIVFSGNGLQAKWLFDKPLPQMALPRWQRVQQELCRQFLPFGADARARDVSRVLRVVGTQNSSGGEFARVVHEARTPTMGGLRLESGLIGHDFEVFQDTVLPVNRQALEALTREREEQSLIWQAEKAGRDAIRAQWVSIPGGKSDEKRSYPNLRPFVPSELAWARVGDIRTLARLRGWTEGAPSGERNLLILLCGCFLAQAVIVPRLHEELCELALEFAPTWTSADVRSCASSVYARADAARQGKRFKFGDRLVDPRYYWTNARLLHELNITASEQPHLKTIISPHEKVRRAKVKRLDIERAAGVRPRAAYLADGKRKRDAARCLHAQGMSFPAIASELKISVGAAHGYCKK